MRKKWHFYSCYLLHSSFLLTSCIINDFLSETANSSYFHYRTCAFPFCIRLIWRPKCLDYKNVLALWNYRWWSIDVGVILFCTWTITTECIVRLPSKCIYISVESSFEKTYLQYLIIEMFTKLAFYSLEFLKYTTEVKICFLNRTWNFLLKIMIKILYFINSFYQFFTGDTSVLLETDTRFNMYCQVYCHQFHGQKCEILFQCLIFSISKT